MSETIRRDAQALTLDMFQIFIPPLEAELGAKSSHAAGRSHGIANSHEYFARMEAINFTQAYDDGAATRDLDKAQVILVGVSRCGKTPTSLYLALQFGIRAANFPLTPDDFADRRLPASVLPFRERLFGLTIQPERLREIREERRPGSHYAQLDNCRYEVREAEHLMQREQASRCSTRRRNRSRRSRRRSCIARSSSATSTDDDAAQRPHRCGAAPAPACAHAVRGAPRCRTASKSITAAAAAALERFAARRHRDRHALIGNREQRFGQATAFTADRNRYASPQVGRMEIGRAGHDACDDSSARSAEGSGPAGEVHVFDDGRHHGDRRVHRCRCAGVVRAPGRRGDLLGPRHVRRSGRR